MCVPNTFIKKADYRYCRFLFESGNFFQTSGSTQKLKLMSFKVDRFHSSNLHYNPLILPLLNFHGMIIRPFRDLSNDGKVMEVIRRVGIAIVSPFAYLVLAFMALFGLLLNDFWKNRPIVKRCGAKFFKEKIIGPNSYTFPGAFDKEAWEKAFPVSIKRAPPLSSNLKVNLEQADPYEPGKKLKDTCQLFLRPEKVVLLKNGKEVELTFNCIEELAKTATQINKRTKYQTVCENLRDYLSKVPAMKAGWVLMRKEVIPGSRTLSFKDQKSLLKGKFEAPSFIDVILLNILTYASEGRYLYGTYPYTYTRSQEEYLNHQVIIGGFGPSGLLIDFEDIDSFYLGLTGVWQI